MKLYLIIVKGGHRYYVVENNINSAIEKLRKYLKLGEDEYWEYYATFALNIMDEEVGIFE